MASQGAGGRIRYGVLDAQGRKEVLVDGVAGHVFERHWDCFVAPRLPAPVTQSCSHTSSTRP
ncbi:hypothetical protein SNE510_72550 [Streptomyces sp. NE5-10]|nr:hypothetical protein SNE510_72550 [Streptomyces sp. NE5-10]